MPSPRKYYPIPSIRLERRRGSTDSDNQVVISEESPSTAFLARTSRHNTIGQYKLNWIDALKLLLVEEILIWKRFLDEATIMGGRIDRRHGWMVFD